MLFVPLKGLNDIRNMIFSGRLYRIGRPPFHPSWAPPGAPQRPFGSGLPSRGQASGNGHFCWHSVTACWGKWVPQRRPDRSEGFRSDVTRSLQSCRESEGEPAAEGDLGHATTLRREGGASPPHGASGGISLLDHLLGTDEDGRGEGDPKGLGRLHIEDQLEPHGLLHGQVGRLCTLQDLVHIDSAAPV